MSKKTNIKKVTKPKKSNTTDKIIIKGARVHNLKNINVEIPKNKFVVITGISGSGKSSLALDTLYREGQRRYVESLSSYARQFLGPQDKPDVDQILGLSPAIAIDQRTASHNPRSTVGTMTEIYDYLRLLFARIGQMHCPECGGEIRKQTKEQILEKILSLGSGKKIIILAPVIKDKKGEHKKVLEEINKAGFTQVRIDGEFYFIQEAFDTILDPDKKHNLDVAINHPPIPERVGVAEGVKGVMVAEGREEMNGNSGKVECFTKALDTALDLGNGLTVIYDLQEKKEYLFSEHFSCPKCDINLPDLEPRLFSFNSPYGACPVCAGLGVKQEIDPELVVPNKKLTLAQGAIRPWLKMGSRNNSQLMLDLEKVAEKNNFSLQIPVNDLTKKQIDLILYGTNDFEGVIPNLVKKYQEANSDYIRNEIEKYMRFFTCPECQGQRLNKMALSVTVTGKNIAEISSMTIEEAKEFFSTLSRV